MFSPYYAFARRRSEIDPLDHCAINVALYGAAGKRWAMTERKRGDVARSPDHFSVGPSRLRWDGQSLEIDIDEITNPLPSRLRGTVRVRPLAINRTSFTLDGAGRHRWWPIAPCSRVEVELGKPSLRWSGNGYFDINHGDRPLETDFRGWEWSRAATSRGTIISYDTTARAGEDRHLALRVDPFGTVDTFAPLRETPLPRTGWRIDRNARADAGTGTRVVRTLEDTPFYARSHLAGKLFGEPADIMHESLSLDRFRNPVVQAMLPFRMPRW